MRVVTACLAAAVLASSASITHASTTDRIDRARAQLRGLAEQVAAQSVAVEDARARADAAGARAAQAGQALIPLTVHRIELAQRAADTEVELVTAQSELNAAAVEAFISSPGTVPGGDTLAALLGAQSLEQLQDRIAYGEAVARDREAAIEQVAVLHDRLAGQVATQDALVAAAEDVRARREASLEEQQAALAQEQEALAGLAAARDSVVALLDRLRARLAPADVAAVAQAFQGSENVSYGEWAHAFLEVMGAPTCHANLVVTIAWQAQEGTQAAWNPLATTHRMEGSTDFNSVGVQNFLSLAQGLQASKETIENGWDVYRYGAIIRSMRDCADPLDTARAIADVELVLRVRRGSVRDRDRARRRGVLRNLRRPVGTARQGFCDWSFSRRRRRADAVGVSIRPRSPPCRSRNDAHARRAAPTIHPTRSSAGSATRASCPVPPAPAAPPAAGGRAGRRPRVPPAPSRRRPDPGGRVAKIVVGVVVALVVGGIRPQRPCAALPRARSRSARSPGCTTPPPTASSPTCRPKATKRV